MCQRRDTTPTEAHRKTPWRKASAAVFSLLLMGAVLWPVGENWRETPQDNFPLSFYPMFTKRRPEVARLTHLVGLDSAGHRYTIPYTYAGTGGLHQVRKQIRKVVVRGEAKKLCRRVARRVTRRNEERLRSVVSVCVVTGSYCMHEFLRGNRVPESLKIEATYKVRRDRP